MPNRCIRSFALAIDWSSPIECGAIDMNDRTVGLVVGMVFT